MKIAGDILRFDEFFISDEALEYEEKPFSKRIHSLEVIDRLRRLSVQFQEVDCFDAANCESIVRSFVEAEGIKIGEIIHALRLAVTGKAKGVGMFETLAILGRESTMHRIQAASEKAEAQIRRAAEGQAEGD